MRGHLCRLGLLAFVVAPLATACTDNSSDGSTDAATTVQVESSADQCILSADTAAAGTIVFRVDNTGTEVTEFYLLAEDGVDIVSEVENIGPGVGRDMTVDVEPGSYVTACKPGMTGDGIRGDFTVTGEG